MLRDEAHTRPTRLTLPPNASPAPHAVVLDSSGCLYLFPSPGYHADKGMRFQFDRGKK
ncbi:hypothetical protein F7725_025323 [Dissostichus mawsoni]|uniref:Uncharacterized protein n=1 Tax=Dissostichus mawsoni TaxID=36200 RepID=A0A7J5XBR0_DISMA|nr:hypothetical protein F7725_025323 [Dissostichus mawsoni]